jgi:hypothetical protein
MNREHMPAALLRFGATGPRHVVIRVGRRSQGEHQAEWNTRSQPGNVPVNVPGVPIGNLSGDDIIASQPVASPFPKEVYFYPNPVPNLPDVPTESVQWSAIPPSHAGWNNPVTVVTGYSIKKLLKFWYSLNNGDLVQPPQNDPTQPDASYRLSFRELLAIAANP